MKWLSWILAVLFLASCWGYFALEPGADLFIQWAILYTIQFALYLTLIFLLSRYGIGNTTLWILTGVAARVVLWYSAPVLETDYYRYLWDGHVYSEGVNPYLYPPNDPALDDLETDYRGLIGWAQFRTIYPPLSQYLFLASASVAPGSLVFLKAILTLFDLATGLLLIRWLERIGTDTRWSLVYFLNL